MANEKELPISFEELIWWGAQKDCKDIISSAWHDVAWDDLPEHVQSQFKNLVYTCADY